LEGENALNPVVRKSWPSRLSAVGFIMVILFGNLWLTFALLGQQVPNWARNGFALGLCLTLVGAVLLMAFIAHLKLKGASPQDPEAP
jgi:hypothetical protein